MQGWIEQALRNLTQRVEYLFRLISDLQAQLNNMRQQLLAAYQASGSGGSGGAAIVYFWVPGGTISAASGPPPSGVPVGTSGQTVYALSSGTYSTVSTSATIYNAAGSTLVASKVVFLGKNTDGTYTALTQSCA